VASHRRPKSPSRTRTRVTFLSAAAVTAVALSANGAAQAAPSESISQIKADIDNLNNQADAAIQKYDGAQEQLKNQQAQVSTIQDEVARQQAQVNTLQENLASVATAEYRGGTVSNTVQLMLSSDPSTFLEKASTLDQLTASQAGMLKQLESQQTALSAEKSQAEAKLAQAQATAQQLASDKAAVQQKLAAAQAKLNSLDAQQKAQVQQAENAGTSVSVNLNLSGTSGSAAAAAAFAAAKTRLGDPYVYGAKGPSSFDCSGLVQWAYAQAGVSLPRTTYDQENIGTAVSSLADAQIGDLVIFNGGEHVGLYAGTDSSGQPIVLHAPHTGTVVKFETVSTIGSVYTIRRV
jgi:cell wall-associated NlpC family hydrolase